MTKQRIVFFIFFSLWVQPILASPFAKILRESTKELLDSSKDNLKKPETYDKYINMAVSGSFDGATDEIIKDLTSEFTQEKVTKALFENMVKMIAPMALGPVKLMWQAADLTKDYTNYMLGWMEGQIKQDFNKNVLSRYNTSSGVKQEFNYYMDNRFYLLKGIPPTRRPRLKQELWQAYHKRYILLKKKELAEQAKQTAKIALKRKLRIAVGLAKKQLQIAQFTLKGAQEPITDDNLRRFLHDKKYKEKMIKKDQEYWAKIEAGEKKAPRVSIEEEGELAVQKVALVKKVKSEPRLPTSHQDYISKIGELKEKVFQNKITLSEYQILSFQIRRLSKQRSIRCIEKIRTYKKIKNRQSYYKKCNQGSYKFIESFTNANKTLEKERAAVMKMFHAFIKPDVKNIYKRSRSLYGTKKSIQGLFSTHINVRRDNRITFIIRKKLVDEIKKSRIFRNPVYRQDLRELEKGFEKYIKNLGKAISKSKYFESKLERLVSDSESLTSNHNKVIDKFCEQHLSFIRAANGSVDKCSAIFQDNEVAPKMYSKLTGEYLATEDFRLEAKTIKTKMKKYYEFTRKATLSNDDFFTVYNRLYKIHEKQLPIKIFDNMRPSLNYDKFRKKFNNDPQSKHYYNEIKKRTMDSSQVLTTSFLNKFFTNYLKVPFTDYYRHGIARVDIKSKCDSTNYHGVKLSCSKNSFTTIVAHESRIKLLITYQKQIKNWSLVTRSSALLKTISEFEKAMPRLSYFTVEAITAKKYFITFIDSVKGLAQIIQGSNIADLLNGKAGFNLDHYNTLFSDYEKNLKKTKRIVESSIVIFAKYQDKYEGEAGTVPKDFTESVQSEVWKHVSQEYNTTLMIKKAYEMFQGRSFYNLLGKDKIAIKKFYKEFKNAYQRKREGVLLSMIDPNWSAGEITISDLEDNLLRTFDVFDRLRFNYNISSIEQQRNSRKYKVRYKLKIASKIYKRKLSRKEGSFVIDLVEVNGFKDNRKVKILKTITGNLWMTE